MGRIDQPESRRDLSYVGSVVFGADHQVGQWVAARIPDMVLSPGSRALGVVKRGKLVAGVVFENWNGVHIQASIAAEPGAPWADRSTLFALFHYPFKTLGCEAISVTVPSSNPLSLNLATKLGFSPEAFIKYAAHDGSSLVVLKMFRSDCKWIDQHGRKQQGRGQPAETT